MSAPTVFACVGERAVSFLRIHEESCFVEIFSVRPESLELFQDVAHALHEYIRKQASSTLHRVLDAPRLRFASGIPAAVHQCRTLPLEQIC